MSGEEQSGDDPRGRLPNARMLRLVRAGAEFLSSTEEVIDEARNGRMFIIVDDETSENGGVLVIPAQMTTPNAINFMAKHGRGLICLALTNQRISELGLSLMNRDSNANHRTAFATSIEAREGVTTGISAADRARTIAVAIDSSRGPEHIVTPGHVFPLIATEGGVLIRAGYPEAAVDLARLAGLNPSAVICEILAHDGTLAQMDDLIAFAEVQSLKIGTIRDLIALRRRDDHLVEKRAEAKFTSRWGGEWTAIAFWNKVADTETLALVKGRVDPTKPTLVRMHTLSSFADIFAEDSQRAGILASSMEMIGEAGSGVVVVINRRLPDGLSRVVKAHAKEKAGQLHEMEELRDYGLGAQVLTELGIHEMILLTNSHHSLVGLAAYDLSIVGQREIPPGPLGP